jgi:hypothetical protein
VARFTVTPSGALDVHLDHEEGDLLRRLREEMHALLSEGEHSTDPVTTRLFPDAYDAADEARAYKQLVGDDLRRGKLTALDELGRHLGPRGEVDVHLPPEAVDAWLTSLNDMRLAIGTRLEVNEERMSAEIDERDPDAPAISVLHWLGWLQQSMLEARAGTSA